MNPRRPTIPATAPEWLLDGVLVAGWAVLELAEPLSAALGWASIGIRQAPSGPGSR